MELLRELEATIFNVDEENFEAIIQQTMKLFDSKFPTSFNIMINKLVYSALLSKKNELDIYLKYLQKIQSKEEENDPNIPKILENFVEYLTKIDSQESYYIIAQMIDQNLADASVVEYISSIYFSYLKPKSQSIQWLPKIDQFSVNFMKNFEKLSKNSWELQKKLVKEGVNPNEIAKMIRNDEIEKLQEITSQNNFDFNQTIEPSLYERCSFINQENVTLIDYAAFFSSIKCFKYLLMNGAKLDKTGKYAVAGGNLEIIHLCQQNHSAFENPYEIAIEFHQNDVFKYIYEKKLGESQENIEPNKQTKNENKINDLICLCIDKDNYEILSYLEGKGMEINDNMMNKIAKSGNLYLFKYFHQSYQVPNDVLVFASISGNDELVKYILEQEEIDINAKYEGDKAIHIAVRNNKIKIVKLLLEQKGIDINEKSQKSGEAILYTAVRSNYMDMVKLLLQQEGIDVNLKNGWDEASLHVAIKNNNIEMVKLLLDHKDIDVNAKNNGVISLHIAQRKGYTKIAKLLLEKAKSQNSS